MKSFPLNKNILKSINIVHILSIFIYLKMLSEIYVYKRKFRVDIVWNKLIFIAVYIQRLKFTANICTGNLLIFIWI